MLETKTQIIWAQVGDVRVSFFGLFPHNWNIEDNDTDLPQQLASVLKNTTKDTILLKTAMYACLAI